MTLPIRAVTRPAVLAGLDNGRLPASMLVDTPGQAGGPVVRLVAPAARGWRALVAAARADGHILKATSIYDSYRPLWVQEQVFRQRCTTTPITNVQPRWWQGQWWYLRPGYAPVATPGTSNHGWALAVDTGEERDQDTGTESMDQATLAWLVAHELDYGYSHELQVEPWHIRYFAGDRIPAAVLAHEQGEDMSLRDDVDGWYLMHRVLGMQRLDDPIRIPEHKPSRTPARSEPNLLAAALAKLDTLPAAVVAALPEPGPGGLTRDDVEAAVRAVLAPGLRLPASTDDSTVPSP